MPICSGNPNYVEACEKNKTRKFNTVTEEDIIQNNNDKRTFDRLTTPINTSLDSTRGESKRQSRKLQEHDPISQRTSGWASDSSDDPGWYHTGCSKGWTHTRGRDDKDAGFGGWATDHQWWKTCTANDDHDDSFDTNYGPYTIKQKTDCCAIDRSGLSNSQDKETQQKCNPYGPKGQQCHQLMKTWCTGGSNTFNKTGDSGTGNFFSQSCQQWMNMSGNEKYLEDAKKQMCSKTENLFTTSCKTWCDLNPENKAICKIKIQEECSKPEMWDTQECLDWCNKDCFGGDCPNLELCKEFVEKPENCGTMTNPGAKYRTAACACYNPLEERGISKYNDENMHAIVSNKTSCIDDTCKGYMSMQCNGDIMNCVQSIKTNNGVNKNFTQTQKCLQGEDYVEPEEPEPEDDGESSDDDESDPESDSGSEGDDESEEVEETTEGEAGEAEEAEETEETEETEATEATEAEAATVKKIEKEKKEEKQSGIDNFKQFFDDYTLEIGIGAGLFFLFIIIMMMIK